MKYQANVAGVPCVVDVETLKPESLEFLIEYGIKQYLADGAAVSKEWKTGDRKGELKTEEEIAAEKEEGVRERLQNIADGTFVRRGTAEKLSPEETIRQRILIEKIEAAGRAAKVKLPNRTGKDANKDWWTDKMAALYAKTKDAVDKEVRRQMKEREVVVEIDLT